MSDLSRVSDALRGLAVSTLHARRSYVTELRRSRHQAGAGSGDKEVACPGCVSCQLCGGSELLCTNRHGATTRGTDGPLGVIGGNQEVWK
jgi:hypothetical protein